LDFNTGQTIKRRTIIQVPINEIVINLVHKLAEADGIKEGLKITNKKNVILYDTSWIIGLDYYNANYEDEQDKSKQERDKINPNEIYGIRSQKIGINTKNNKVKNETYGDEKVIHEENTVFEESSNLVETEKSEESEQYESE
jgi:hypothetical protein